LRDPIDKLRKYARDYSVRKDRPGGEDAPVFDEQYGAFPDLNVSFERSAGQAGSGGHI
jgi:hypothetical protein